MCNPAESIPVTMTFDNSRNRIRIPKSTLVALGNPSYIIMRVNKEEKRWMLQPATPESAKVQGVSMSDLMRIPRKVYEQNTGYEFQNQRLMSFIREFVDEWRAFAKYRVKGTVCNGVAILQLDDYEIILQRKPLKLISSDAAQ